MIGIPKRNEQARKPSARTLPIPVHWIDTTPVKIFEKTCAIRSLDLNVHVSGLYADVSETIVISNPNKRELSVDLAIPLPDRAVVCGYALDIEGHLIDGVVVPKEKARIAFETEQRRGADPGLVEAVKGNVHRTRVYPVPAHGQRTVQLRYVAPLLVVDGSSAYLDAPMPAERLGERTIHIDVELLNCPAPELSGVNGAQFKELGTCWSVEAHERNVAASESVRVALPKLPASFALVERDAEGAVWFAASEIAHHGNGSSATESAPAITALTVLWDVSGSRAGMDHEAEIALVRSYCAAGTIVSYRLVAFSDQAQNPRTFDTVDELLACIRSLRYDGGSSFQALSQAVTALHDNATGNAYILFTDGMDTLSDEPFSLPAECAVLAVVSGAQRDMEALRQACAGRVFDLAAAPKDAETLAQALFCSNSLTGASGEGTADIMGIGSGSDGRFTVVGKLTSPTATLTFANTKTLFSLDAASAREDSTIARAWAALRVAQLSPRADENADELLELGRRFGVVSPSTSLLVLETLDQWLRYDIEPPATWESMHQAWLQHQAGIMRLSSEEGLAQDHLANLIRAWIELREWWQHDYSARKAPVANGMRFCPTCGRALIPNSLFCPYCGTRIPEALHNANTNFSGPEMSSGAFSIDDVRGMPLEASHRASWGGAPEAMREMAFASAPRAAAPQFQALAEDAVEDREGLPSEDSSPAATIQVKAWMPNADYLKALDEALGVSLADAHDAYFEQRDEYRMSPSFFVDCACWFLANDDKTFGLRVLTNLAELRIEDAALLRVMAWRLREARELKRALVILRRVLKLRPEDSQSHRDIALVLDELAREAFDEGDEAAARRYTEEAGAFYRTIALKPWQRRSKAIGLFAVEEYNVLRSWADAQTWETAPQLDLIDEDLDGVLDCDLRITLSWDADETDVDLHVTEPSGEEAYYGNRRTHSGGRVSEDITDGYGPELYEIRRAQNGVYSIRAHYYASHQQTVFGPASCTLTIYTDWGRPTQKHQITSTRLEAQKEMVAVGTATYGDIAQ